MIDPEGAAFALRSKHRLRGIVSEADMETVLAAEQLTIDDGWPLRGRLTEVYVSERGNPKGFVAIRRGLPSAEVRWLVAHALGHHTMHRTNRYILDRVTLSKREREAEIFAGAFLVTLSNPCPPAWELAEAHGVPQKRLERWFALRYGSASISAKWAGV